MKISDLRHIIVIEEKDGDTNEEYGGKDFEWVELFSVRAKRVYLNTGNEDVAADKVTSFMKVAWIVRKTNQIDTSMRIAYEGLIYDIITIQEVDRFWIKIISELQQ